MPLTRDASLKEISAITKHEGGGVTVAGGEEMITKKWTTVNFRGVMSEKLTM